jgi:VWFA-related protein
MPAAVALAFLTLVFLVAEADSSRRIRPQEQSAAPPIADTYRSGTVILRVDASVVDGSGHTVPGLTPADFHVEIDGRRRAVRFADPPEASRPDPAAGSRSFATNAGHAAGRAVTVVVDLESIRAGAERTLLNTAASLVERLRPADAVALVPVPGPSTPLTREHARVAGAIRNLRGTNNVPNFRHFFTLDEALAYERGDKRVIDEVVERECARDVEAVRVSQGRNAACPPDLLRETRERVIFERQHGETVLAALLGVSRSLEALSAPSTLILISGGIGFDPLALGRFQEVAAQLKAAGIDVYAVQVDQPEVDASSSRPAKGSTYSSQDRQAGLANVATMADGAFFAGVGKAAGVFDRLQIEIAERYALGIESEPGDLDGKPHALRVQVDRPGAVTRARRRIVAVPAPAAADARLASVMATPIDAGDLPISAAAFTIRGDEAESVKVFVRADIGRGAAGVSPVRYAATILGKDGQAVMQTNGTVPAPDGVGSVLLSSQLIPGAYRVRIAAVDASGRAGSLEMPFAARMRSVKGLQVSDLLPGAAGLAPAIFVQAGSPFGSGLELSTAEVDLFAHTSVQFEVRPADDSAPSILVDAPLAETAYDRQRMARASIPTERLPPGEYTVTAAIAVDGAPAGRLTRTFVVVPGAPAVAAAAPATAPIRAVPVEQIPVSDPALRPVLEKLASYVAAYGQNTQAVLAIEKYTQYLDDATRPRRLTSEFALVKTGAARWLGYRDVIEVDGNAVADRRDRLLNILKTSSNPLEEAGRLVADSARFNVGPVIRNFNVPTTALLFFDGAGLARFGFTRKGTKTINGVETWEIAFRETAVPTLITTRAGVSVPAQGTLWISPEDGIVVRTRLQLKGFADAIAMAGSKQPVVPVEGGSAPAGASSSGGGATPAQAPAGGNSGGAGGGGGQTGNTGSARFDRGNRVTLDDTMTTLESYADIEVTYQRNPELAMWLPVRMAEEYQGPIMRLNRPPVQGISRATAVYTDYKSFETDTRVVGPKK